jgi:hypothetical protein
MSRFLLLSLMLSAPLSLTLGYSHCFAQAALGLSPTATVPASQSEIKPIKTATKNTPFTKPLWAEIKVDQQNALLPLQYEWTKLSEVQKRKWLEISKNFGKLQPEEQAKLHSRMKEWVALSPQQRAQARLNFSTAKTLAPEEKQKRWEAYQALSAEEKQKLQTNAKANTFNSAALANKPQNKAAANSKLQPLPPASVQAAPAKAE